MKIVTVAYHCNNCNQPSTNVENIVGIRPVADMFETMANSYPIESKNIDECEVHLCTDCYNSEVIVNAKNAANGCTESKEYEIKRDELSFLLRRKLIANEVIKRAKMPVGAKKAK